MTIEQGRPLVPVTPTTDPLPLAGPAIPVVGYTEQPAGRPYEGGPALPVYLVNDAELGSFGLQAGPAVPMVLASAVGVTPTVGQRPIPVYVVAGSLNPTPPVPAGMELAWGLDAAPYTAFVGTAPYTATGTVTSAAGIIGCAAAFGGAGYLSTPDQAAARLASGIAIEVWAYRSAGGDGNIITKDAPGPREWTIYYFEDGVDFAMWDGGGALAASTYTNGLLPLDTWTHIIGAYDGTAARLYTNGVLRNTVAYAGSLASTVLPVVIGANAAGNSPMTGRIDEPRIWQFGGAGDPGAAFWLARYNGGAGQSDRGTVAPCP